LQSLISKLSGSPPPGAYACLINMSLLPSFRDANMSFVLFSALIDDVKLIRIIIINLIYFTDEY
jgi:hypothetical protein